MPVGTRSTSAAWSGIFGPDPSSPSGSNRRAGKFGALLEQLLPSEVAVVVIIVAVFAWEEHLDGGTRLRIPRLDALEHELLDLVR